MSTPVVRLTRDDFPRLARELGQEVDRVVEASAKNIATIVTRGMADPKSGRFYGSHQASAPGEMPAIDTGNLAAIKTEKIEQGHWVTYTEAEYAAHLEFGTSRMLPRPFFVPAAEDENPRFQSNLRDIEGRLE